ncbi:MAG: L,D-transpeptidase [bacterium]
MSKLSWLRMVVTVKHGFATTTARRGLALISTATVCGPALSAVCALVLRAHGPKAIVASMALLAGCGDHIETTATAATAAPAAPAAQTGSLDVAALTRDSAKIEKSLADYIPKDPYIVVDTNKNMVYFKHGDEVIHEALCSTGCDSILRAEDGRVWNFATPKGLFKIKNKIKNPTWVKPDWAFIEENLPVPKRDHPDRFDTTAMGSFALDFGDGYYIHGTLYRRLLGENITHGCVRVADEDLEPIFTKTKIGTLVYVF